MGFIKYSVLELGIEETVPGWVKQASDASTEQKPATVDAPAANINTDEQEEEPKTAG